MTKILKTKRTTLRLATFLDSDALMPVLGCAEVMHYSMTGVMVKPQIIATIAGWMSSYHQYGFGPWVMLHEWQVVGYAGLDVRLAKAYWGKGLATEVAEAVRDYAFEVLGKKEIIALIDPVNTASIRTVTKIGMGFTKMVHYGGLDLSLYRLVRE
jgi:ribosomal-protein-alanine N-acetyltransferase